MVGFCQSNKDMKEVTSKTLRRRNFPPRERMPNPPRAFALSFASIGKMLSPTRVLQSYKDSDIKSNAVIMASDNK